MKIAGFQRTTLLDYPGKVSSVIFLDRCNFRCPFCHNPDLVTDINPKDFLDEEEIFGMLEARKHLVDAVVITGGEPCLSTGLYELVSELKKRGFFVKLDTNGAFPHVIENLLNKNLLDYVAMDIKTSLEREKYDKVAGVHNDISKIKESIHIIMNSGIDYEFRTTAIPGFISEDDILDIGVFISGARKYVLQQFVNNLKMIDLSFMNRRLYEPDELKDMKRKLQKYVDNVEIRGI